MATISASTSLPSGALIDPTKQAEYPIVLGDRLAAKESAKQSRLINIQYNYKSKSATPQQRSIITPSPRSRDAYNLTITDKAPTAEQNTLTYTYEGSVDPGQPVSGSEERNLVLVFDPTRKVFVLESVATQLNFNLRSAPAKTTKQVLEQYVQLKTLLEDDQASGDDRVQGGANSEDEGPADEGNPYDYRHFLPKAKAEDDKSASDISTPEPPNYKRSKNDTPVAPAATTKPAAGPPPRSKPQTKSQAKPARQNKRAAKPATEKEPPATKSNTKPPAGEESESSPSNTATGLSSNKAAPSPGSNIIIDGDLIIDMGSPPPSRPAFKVNPAHFSSSNTPNLADDDEEMEDLRLPSPAGHAAVPTPAATVETAPSYEDEVEDDDALAAEMEAAFEESAREEEEARSQQYQQQHQQYNIPSDDESEVSEEE